MTGQPHRRPPLHRWLAYRLFSARVPYECRYWVRQDVLGRWQLTRAITFNLIVITVFQYAVLANLSLIGLIENGEYRYFRPENFRPLVIPLAAWCLMGALDAVFPQLSNYRRRSILRKHDFHPDGSPIEYPPPSSPSRHHPTPDG